MNTLPSVAPVFGLHYDIGWVFFSLTHKDFVSLGIRLFESPFDTLEGDLVPSHTGIISGEDEVIEAEAKGVVKAPLKWRFTDEHTIIWTRKPRAFCQEMGIEIVKGASLELGKRYNYWMIGAHLFSNTLTGKGIDWLTLGWLSNTLTHCADTKRADICSMVTGYGLVRSGIFMAVLGDEKGILSRDVHTLKPSDLDNDRRIFQPRMALAR